MKAVDLPVTLKMRTGWDDKNRNAPRLAKIAESCGIRMVTVHGRTRNQMFAGSADWRFIRAVKEIGGYEPRNLTVITADIDGIETEDDRPAGRQHSPGVAHLAIIPTLIPIHPLHVRTRGMLVTSPRPSWMKWPSRKKYTAHPSAAGRRRP